MYAIFDQALGFYRLDQLMTYWQIAVECRYALVN